MDAGRRHPSPDLQPMPGTDTAGAPILEVKNLIKHYPGVKAVEGVSFAVHEGTCFGLLGPNGAGKTTIVEIMEGITPATSGQVLYRGQPTGATFKEQAGIQFQSTALQEFLTVGETLRLFRQLYSDGTELEKLIDDCSLRELLDRDTRKLSGGQRQRLLLAIALVNNPRLVFLDEPTTGLDPQARRNFWQLIDTIKSRNTTIILTTHYMDEAYTLCDVIAIMDHGKIIAQGSPERLLKDHFSEVILELPKHEFPSGLDLPFTILETHDYVEISTSDVNGAIRELVEKGVSLARLRIRPRNLEDLFLELTGKELRS